MLLQECLIFGNFVLETTEKVQFPGRVGELYLRGVRHRGIATAAVAYDHQLIGTLLQLEGGMSEIGHVRGLVNLLHARTIYIIHREVQSGAYIRCSFCRPGKTRKRCLFDLEDADPQVAFGIFSIYLS